MTERSQHWPTPSPTYYPTNDPATAVLLERQSNIQNQLDRIEHKVDQIPKNGKAKNNGNGSTRTGGIMVAGAWFRDWKSLVMWAIILLMVFGHITPQQIGERLLDKL